MEKSIKRATNSDEFAADGLYSEQPLTPRGLNAEHRSQTLHDTIDIVLGELSDELLCVSPTRAQQLKTAAIAVIRIL